MWLSLFWLLLTLLPLLAFERWLRQHLFGLGLILSGSLQVAEFIYFLVLLPGVVIHELSHWLAAWLLGVPTGHVSVWPARQRDGSLRLGYVETGNAGPLREALIGVAPLFSGALLVLLIGERALGVANLGMALVAGDLASVLRGLAGALQAPDVWLWLYLIFALANAMLPSPSDRRAWPLAVLAGSGAAGALALAGLAAGLAELVAAALRSLAAAFTFAIAADGVVVVVVWLAEAVLGRLPPRQVEH